MSQTITRKSLLALVGTWIAQGKRVAGPQKAAEGLVLYRPLAEVADLLLEGFIRPGNSIKEFLFPRHEKLYGYRMAGKKIELFDAEPPAAEQIVVAARPCDAASLPILDHVFTWDYDDGFYTRRREQTTVITLACTAHDADCFCTSVGGAPDGERGSDVLLLDLGDGSYEVRCLTDKGRALFQGHAEESNRVAQVPPGPQRWLDSDGVREFLATGFQNPLWKTASLRCLGCGACAYTCPTCHCFDIADERSGRDGARVRNWDACQFSQFTMHASGHNPRSRQWQRQRQRISHKFNIYVEKFGETLCTGCGNCTRNCPVSLGVRPVLAAIQQAVATGHAEGAPLASRQSGQEMLQQAARAADTTTALKNRPETPDKPARTHDDQRLQTGTDGSA